MPLANSAKNGFGDWSLGGLFNVYTTSRGVLDYQKEEVLRLGVGNCWGNGSGMGTRAGARQLVYETGLRWVSEKTEEFNRYFFALVLHKVFSIDVAVGMNV